MDEELKEINNQSELNEYMEKLGAREAKDAQFETFYQLVRDRVYPNHEEKMKFEGLDIPEAYARYYFSFFNQIKETIRFSYGNDDIRENFLKEVTYLLKENLDYSDLIFSQEKLNEEMIDLAEEQSNELETPSFIEDPDYLVEISKAFTAGFDPKKADNYYICRFLRLKRKEEDFDKFGNSRKTQLESIRQQFSELDLGVGFNLIKENSD